QVRDPLGRDGLDDEDPHAQLLIAYPPSTGIAVPVTKSDAALARNTAMPSMSSIVPQRPAGVRDSTLSCRPFTCLRAFCVSSVSIQPGNTALTWMLSVAHATAVAFVSWTMPPLLAAYAG